MSGDELRRRAQPLLERPPYEARPLDELRRRARERRRRSQRAIAALAVIVVLGAGIGTFAVTRGTSGPGVKVRTTNPPTPSSTVPASTTIADLRITPIAGPRGSDPVELFAAGDQFLAVSRVHDVTDLWTGDARGQWTRIAVPTELRHAQLDSVERVDGRDYVVARTPAGVVVLEGIDLAHLRASNWKLTDTDLPRALDPAPPTGRGIVVEPTISSVAVGESGVVLVGTVTADLDRRVLPAAMRDRMARDGGVRAEVDSGRVVIKDDDGAIVYDVAARSLGLGHAVVDYLQANEFWRSQSAVWGAQFGAPVRRLAATAIVDAGLDANSTVQRLGGGFLFAGLWSRDGATWRPLADAGKIGSVVDLGARWIVPGAQLESDNQGRSWMRLEIGRAPLETDTGFDPRGTPGFGALGAAASLDPSTGHFAANRLYYSPDGVRWSSTALRRAVHLDADIPRIAVSERAAVLETARDRNGPQQQFWLVTIAP